MINAVFLNRLRLLSICEGISTLVLFGVAMPLKYFGGLPMAVTIVGSLHGFLFVCLVAMFLLAVRRVPISVGLALSGIVAAVFPFVTIQPVGWVSFFGGRGEIVPVFEYSLRAARIVSRGWWLRSLKVRKTDISTDWVKAPRSLWLQ